MPALKIIISIRTGPTLGYREGTFCVLSLCVPVNTHAYMYVLLYTYVYLQVSVNDVFLVAVLHCRDDLSEFDSSLLLLHPTVSHQVVKYLTWRRI